MQGQWRYPTRAGVAQIRFNPRTGNYRLTLGDEDLGGYSRPQQAVDDFCGGHTFTPSSGLDTSTLGAPVDVADWEFVPRS
jgi:hypothetical protein